MRGKLLTSTAAAILLWSTAVAAQQNQQQTGPEQQQVAEQCLQDLQALDQEMVEAGYGMTGPAGYGVGAQPPATGWYGTLGPRREMNALFAAAQVLARNGNQEGCDMILGEIREMYEQRTAQIEEAGFAPEEVRGWRQERLLGAQPVTEMRGAISIDNVLGSDVRNLQDEDLGDIEDVVLDDQRNIDYVLVERGGFLGIGTDFVPVRWEDLAAVSDMDTFVLDVPESAFEEAPTLDRDTFANLQTYDERRQQIDQFWDQQLQG